MNKNEILKALDQMEQARHKAQEMPQNYPPDYVFRICEAITAQLAGYTSREAWTDDLNADTGTHYHEFLNLYRREG